MTEPWWSGLLPIDVQLQCLDGVHRVRWDAGGLHALDHDDPDGERALAALGADRSPCIELLDAWVRHTDDLKVLTVASRGASDPVQIEPEGQGPPGVGGLRFGPSGGGLAGRRGPVGGSGWVGFAPLTSNPMIMGPSGTAGDEVISLMGLGGALAQRLVATVIATWVDRLAKADDATARAHPTLTAALYGRVTASVRCWLSNSSIDVELTMIRDTDVPSISRSDDTVRAELPFRWLSDIWVKELSVVLSRFALSSPSSQPDHLELLTISPDFTELRPVTISLS
jgi:hypothetical protein